MPVGTGSINRAARSSKKAAGTVNSASDTKKKETAVKSAAVKAEEVKEAPVEAVASEPAKKTRAKKTTVRKTPPKKETVSAKKAAVKEETEGTLNELKVYAEETVFVVGNDVCQLTQDLPIHLL